MAGPGPLSMAAILGLCLSGTALTNLAVLGGEDRTMMKVTVGQREGTVMEECSLASPTLYLLSEGGAGNCQCVTEYNKNRQGYSLCMLHI